MRNRGDGGGQARGCISNDLAFFCTVEQPGDAELYGVIIDGGLARALRGRRGNPEVLVVGHLDQGLFTVDAHVLLLKLAAAQLRAVVTAMLVYELHDVESYY